MTTTRIDLAALDPGAVPVALAVHHRALPVGARATIVLPLTGDLRSTWSADRVHGGGFDPDATRSPPAERGGEVAAVRARTLADRLAPGMRLLVCGLNPSLYAADAGVGFARPGNRFWPSLRAARLATVDRDPDHLLAHHHIGMTDLVKRATPRADALEPAEYRAGVGRLARTVEWLQPVTVCVVGFAGWRVAVDRHAVAGWQPGLLGHRPVYLMPNPSGLNAHTPLAGFVAHWHAAAAGPPATPTAPPPGAR